MGLLGGYKFVEEAKIPGMRFSLVLDPVFIISFQKPNSVTDKIVLFTFFINIGIFNLPGSVNRSKN